MLLVTDEDDIIVVAVIDKKRLGDQCNDFDVMEHQIVLRLLLRSSNC